MSEFVTDTHSLIWYLTRDPRLPRTARIVFEEADKDVNRVWVPSIVLVETIYLVEKARFPESLIRNMLALVDPPSKNYPILTLDIGIVRELELVARNQVPEMPDRIIVSSAKFLNVPLISKDSLFANVPGLKLIW